MFCTAASFQIVAAVVLPLALCLPAPLRARSSGNEAVAPDYASLYLNVEKNNQLIMGLGKENFRLYVDGAAVPFRLEMPEQPANIAFLVEFSRISGYYVEDLNEAVGGVLKHAPEGNWYALATYSRQLKIDVDFTDRVGEITNGYSQLGDPVWNEINTYDAIWEMLDKMGRIPGRQILIVVGSGMDTFSEHTLEDVRKKIRQENVTVFVAGAGSLFRTTYEPYLDSLSRMRLAQAQAFLQMMADESGGFAWFPNQSIVFRDVIDGALQSVATQYRLVYPNPPSVPGKLHKIRVEAFRIVEDKREDFKVLVRTVSR